MILERAFVQEVLKTCAAVGAILLAIFMVARVMGFLSEAADGEITVSSLGLLLLLKTITYLDVLAPLVLYISTLLVLGRWAQDSELLVVAASGMSMKQFMPAAIKLFAMVGSLAALFSLYLSPLSAQASRVITYELKHHANLARVIPGEFHALGDGSSVYFAESYEPKSGTLRNIFLYEDEAEDTVLLAQSGRKVWDEATQTSFLELENGHRFRGAAGGGHYADLDFSAYRVRLANLIPPVEWLPTRALPTPRLLNSGRGNAGLAELHWRIAKIVQLPILLIFALAFAPLTYRKKRFPSILAALLVYFGYSNLVGFGVTLIRRGAADPYLALWGIHFAFLTVALVLLHRRHQNLPLFPRFGL